MLKIKQQKINVNRTRRIALILISSLFLTYLLSINLSGLIITDNSKGFYTNQEDLVIIEPRPSGSSINITTPANISYNNPMSGYYPATYGFENDTIGGDPSSWTINEATGTVNVYSSLANHKNILEFHDTGSGNVQITDPISSKENGTVEFWIYPQAASTGAFEFVASDSTHWRIEFRCQRIDNNHHKFMYNNGTSWYDITSSVNSDEWYHIRIDFETSTNGYMGLSEDTWKVQINQVEYGAYTYYGGSSESFISQYFSTNAVYADYYYYLDAVGYSWDPNYNSGDNLEEGLLLSYNNATNLDWQGYSLDGQPNVTIYGNTTLKMPDVGSHKIQISCNDTSGVKYQSAIRWFNIKGIKIQTPENKTYTDPMTGYYPGTIGFDGNFLPDPFDLIQQDSGTNYDLVDELNGHKGILEVTTQGDGNILQMEYNFTELSTGIHYWESWFYCDEWDRFMIHITNDPGIEQANVLFRQDGIIRYDGSGDWSSAGSWTLDAWHHISIKIDMDTEEWCLYYDESEIVTNAGFDDGGTNPYRINFIWGANTGTPTTSYLDAFGFTNESSYTAGDNLNQGLLLSYNINILNLNWTGYCLDGADNITIYGNTTIPMPDFGNHDIQVFANDSENNIYKSEKVWFTVGDSTDPEIQIVSYDSTVEQESTSTFTWKIIEDHPDSYKIFQNGSLINSGGYANDTEYQYGPFLNLTLCDILFEIWANDSSGNENTIQFIVSIVDTTDPNIFNVNYPLQVKQGEYINFSWEVVENNPMNYSVFVNGSLLEVGAYTNDTTCAFGPYLNWTLGELQFEILVNDTEGNTDSAQFSIEIIERDDEFQFLKPNVKNNISLVSEMGLYIQCNSSKLGYLSVQKQATNFIGVGIWSDMIGHAFYSFLIYNISHQEDENVINQITIRFYYDPNEIEDEDNLVILHYRGGFSYVSIWEDAHGTINTEEHYVEITVSDLSYFCLCELDIGGRDKKKDEGDVLWLFTEYGLFIIILAAVGVTIPTGYVISKQKKKKTKTQQKKISDEQYHELEQRAQVKRAALEARMWKPEEPKKPATSELKSIPGVETKKQDSLPALPRKVKKKKKGEEQPKPLTPEEVRETQKTESEMEIKQALDKCTVHKGKIQGITYVCPKCQVKYCMKCAQTLESKNEECWVCGNPIDLGSKEKLKESKGTEINKILLPIDNQEKIIELIKKDISLENISELNDLNITVLSEDFIKKLTDLKMEPKDKLDFIREMFALTPEEREKILNRMIESESEEFRG
ncbi:MAG: LamG-like jellyroll fold domain-containing protein [Promethearchaeota archaeon]